MPQHCCHGLKHDLHIQSQAPVVDVGHVQPYHFIKVLDVGPSAHLPHAGDAGAHGKLAVTLLAALKADISTYYRFIHHITKTPSRLQKTALRVCEFCIKSQLYHING